MIPTLLDVASGFLAFLAVLAAVVLQRQNQDIRPFAVVVYCVFFLVSMLRWRTESSRRWLTPLLVALGGIIPVAAMRLAGIAFTATPFLLSFLVLSICASVIGAGTKLLYARSKHGYAWAAGLTALAAVLAVVLVTIPRLEEDAAYKEVDTDVKSFTVQTLDGEALSSDRWKGHVVVLSFWATWCTPCQAELPQIAALQNRYRNNPKVLVLAVNSGTHGDTPSKAQAYLNRKALPLTGAIDRYGLSPESDTWGPAASSLNLDSLPAVFVLDQSGRLRVIHAGYDASEDLSRSLAGKVDSLL